jgi:SIR2-like domain/Domain of unknown function (DUF4020)
MRLAASLTLPDALERARTAGELVIFAGAGVSMGPPSGLPSFCQLAREIAEPVLAMQPNDEDHLDRYLGRAQRLDIKVEARARDILIRRGGTHSPLHVHLMGLFGEPESVRLITTNFDTHFTAAAQECFPGISVPQYIGPALPPGQGFRGLVQLHGSLAHPVQRLVLTRTDFASAYMTDGWAARFLAGVFAERTILFIGYSLGDPVMQYLMSALPSRRWYAICHEQERARWSDHDVTPVTFNDAADGRRFGDLYDAMQRWHWYANASAVDHDRELRALLEHGVPSSPEEVDYIRVRLSTEAGRLTFWNAAHEARWFAWAGSEKLLDPLFQEESTDTSVIHWARWCMSHFCSGENPPFLQFCRRRDLRLNPMAAFELALHLSRTAELPTRAPMRQFVALLISQARRPLGRIDPYVLLMQRLVVAEHMQEALAMLAWLTELRLEPLGSLQLAFVDEDEVKRQLHALSNQVTLRAPAEDLDHFLEEQGSSLALTAAEGMVELGVKRIGEAYALLELAKGVGDTMDSLSYRRAAIAPSSEDRFRDTEDVLVTLVRIALDHWRDHLPERLLQFAMQHSTEGRRLLKRLSIYALAECRIAQADEVLKRVADLRWFADYRVRPELYGLLKAHFAGASEEAKETVIACLRDDLSWGSVDKHQEHARYNLSQLLLRLSPESPSTRAFAKDQTTAHPEWREADPDGLLRRSESGWLGEEPSPIRHDQLVRWSPGEALEHIVKAFDLAPTGRDALLIALQQAGRVEPTWGVALVNYAADTNTTAPIFTESVLWGLREASPNEQDKLSLLNRMLSWMWPDSLTHPLGVLVERWAKDLVGSNQGALLDALDEAADRVYERAKHAKTALASETGWTERAINHPAGNAASAWWLVANARDRFEGGFVLTIDDRERSRWSQVLNDTSEAGAHARVILGMATDRLSGGDYPWAEKIVFPAFDPRAGTECAAQLWDGRLMQSRWSWATIAGLRPYLSSFFARSDTLVPARSRQLGDWVAMLVANPADSQFSGAELQVFIHHASLDARRAFAEAMPRHIARLPSDARKQLWERTLRPYWRDRRTNMPVSLHPAELVEMIGWIVGMPEVASEMIQELWQTAGEHLEQADYVLLNWRGDDQWVRAHPTEAVSVIRWLAKRKSVEVWTTDEAVKLLETALNAGAPKSDVIAAAEALAELPSEAAVRLLERLRRSDESTC